MADYYLRLHGSDYFNNVQQTIESMASTLERDGIPFYLLIGTELTGYSSFADYPYGPVHRRLAELGSAGVRVVDPQSAFASQWSDPRDLWVTPRDPHKNAEANALMAEQLADAIVANFTEPDTP